MATSAVDCSNAIGLPIRRAADCDDADHTFGQPRPSDGPDSCWAAVILPPQPAVRSQPPRVRTAGRNWAAINCARSTQTSGRCSGEELLAAARAAHLVLVSQLAWVSCRGELPMAIEVGKGGYCLDETRIPGHTCFVTCAFRACKKP